MKGHQRSRCAAAAAARRPCTLSPCHRASDARAPSNAGAVSRSHDARWPSTTGCEWDPSAGGAEPAGWGRWQVGSVQISTDGLRRWLAVTRPPETPSVDPSRAMQETAFIQQHSRSSPEGGRGGARHGVGDTARARCRQNKRTAGAGAGLRCSSPRCRRPRAPGGASRSISTHALLLITSRELQCLCTAGVRRPQRPPNRVCRCSWDRQHFEGHSSRCEPLVMRDRACSGRPPRAAAGVQQCKTVELTATAARS